MDTNFIRTPAPLYDDPVWGGASDPAVIRNRETGEWWMFYTQRRSFGYQSGVASLHGTDIGITVSKDGRKWLYRGIAEGLVIDWGRNTFWAPEVIFADGQYHMFVSYIVGVPSDWSGSARIAHFTSDNLSAWRFEEFADLESNRVIDACVHELPDGRFKMWYKDEERQAHICAAVSRDLHGWEVCGEEITDCASEGPNVFILGGRIWMITDTWNGLGVYVSEDYAKWIRQEGNLLKEPGIRPGDGQIGNHADVVAAGDKGFIFYFVHPDYPAEMRQADWGTLTFREMHTVIQCALLEMKDGRLVLDRNRDFDIREMGDIRDEV